MLKKVPLAVVTGVVTRGRGFGRKLGYPTANLAPRNGEMPKIPHGVYAGWTRFQGVEYLSILSFGKAETIGAKEVCFEVHLLDYKGDLYGKELTVRIEVFLRNMVKFNSFEELKDAIKEDEKQARKLLGEK